MNKKYLLIFLIISSLTIFIYQLGYSETIRLKKNLDGFDSVLSLLSRKVSEKYLNNIYKEDKDYSFRGLRDRDMENFQELGLVDIIGENVKLINSFILFKDHEGYYIHMRNIYMSLG
ncbi:hypothetical protein AAK964_14345 [Tissierella praeacuta]|uniref:hypothetical protein n=1 Tax=Tissierella praeacuta TaxID=43131 RepID=UPI003516349F